MRWFKHFSDARTTPQLRKIEKKLGEAGYARAFKLLELMAQLCGKADSFSPTLDLNGTGANLEYLAESLGISAKDARKTLRVFAEAGFIDSPKWAQKIVYVPSMLDALDEWTGRAKRRLDSGATREFLQSDSGKSQSESQSQQRERKD